MVAKTGSNAKFFIMNNIDKQVLTFSVLNPYKMLRLSYFEKIFESPLNFEKKLRMQFFFGDPEKTKHIATMLAMKY